MTRPDLHAKFLAIYQRAIAREQAEWDGAARVEDGEVGGAAVTIVLSEEQARWISERLREIAGRRG